MSLSSWRILALETSGRTGSGALGTETGLLAAERLPGQMTHASALHPLLEGLLEQQGWPARSLTHVFVSIGPGSFTGLRIGVTVARTLGWSIGADIVAVPTVDVVARNALDAEPVPEHVAVLLDAKRGQVYAAAFDHAAPSYTKTIDVCLADPRSFLARCPRPLAVIGEGVPAHEGAILAGGADVLPAELWPARAEHVYHVGLDLVRAGYILPPGDLVPLYIRPPEAEEKWRQLHPEKFTDRPSPHGDNVHPE